MSTQPDLFAPPPMPALDVHPNEHGVYSKDHAEHLSLPRVRRGWRGSDMAEIRLLHLAEGWVFSVGYMLAESGGGGPLTTHQTYSSRAEALDSAIAELGRRCADKPWLSSAVEKRERAQVRAWLETLA